MPRSLRVLFAGLAAVSMLSAASLFITAPTAAVVISPTVTCNNGLGNGGAVCETTVVNTITPSGASAVVTVRECVGSAGVPNTSCTTTTQSLTEAVTYVNQCEGSINGGGGTLLCSVAVTNNFIGITPAPTVTAATVNQCNGSVTTGTVRACSPGSRDDHERDDHPVQRVGERRGSLAHMHRERHPVLRTLLRHRPVQRLVEWRRNSHRVLRDASRTTCSQPARHRRQPRPPVPVIPAASLPVVVPNTGVAEQVAAPVSAPVIYIGLLILAALWMTAALRFRKG